MGRCDVALLPQRFARLEQWCRAPSTASMPAPGQRTSARADAAMERLLAGRPSYTDGRLIKDNLWKEAQVSWAIINRAPAVLREWDARLAEADRSQNPRREPPRRGAGKAAEPARPGPGREQDAQTPPRSRRGDIRTIDAQRALHNRGEPTPHASNPSRLNKIHGFRPHLNRQ